MNKLFKGEIFKLFHSPIMYFLTGIFILALVIFPSIFTPAERVNRLSEVNLDISSVTACYTSFQSAKQDKDVEKTNIENSIKNLISGNGKFKEKLVDFTNKLYNDRVKFSSAVQNEKANGNDGYISLQTEMINDLNKIENEYKSCMNDFFVPVILANEQLDYNLVAEITALKRKLQNFSGGKDWDDYKGLDQDLEYNLYVPNIVKYIEQLDSLEYSSDELTTILENFKKAKTEYKASLLSEISTLNTSAESDVEINAGKTYRTKMQDLSLHYLFSEYNNIESTKNKVLLQLTKSKNSNYIVKNVGFETYNRYKIQEYVSKCDYLLENDLIDSDISDNFSFNNMSSFGEKANAFDYAYFSLEIMSILIICFTVIIGASMIAKEYSDGTIKLLCVKPYKRCKIISSKILATMFIGFLFTLVATIVSFIVGYFLYGISFPTVLMIFNSTTTFPLPIWLAFIIYLACLMIKVYVYSLLAIAISVLFKSYIASICVSCGIYIANIAVTFASGGANWIKYNMFANIDLFKYFGGSFANGNSSIGLSKIFYSPVFNGTNIFITVGIIVTLIVALNVVSYSVFKKRDIM